MFAIRIPTVIIDIKYTIWYYVPILLPLFKTELKKNHKKKNAPGIIFVLFSNCKIDKSQSNIGNFQSNDSHVSSLINGPQAKTSLMFRAKLPSN